MVPARVGAHMSLLQIKLLLVLGIYLLGAASGAGAAWKIVSDHYKAKEVDRITEASKAMAAMVSRANELSRADVLAARKAEQARQRTRIKQQERAHALELEAVRNHKPECRITDTQHRLFNGAIDDANGSGEEATPGGVSGGLRDPATDERAGGQGRMGLGLKGDQRIWRMSVETPGVRGMGGA